MQCISALYYIHSKNIILKNICLSNVFMSENKIVKLGDFSLSFLANNSELIKDDYQSPETYNNLYYNQKTDIYAIGALFHQLCYFASPNSNDAKFKVTYPSEMENIIQLILVNENKRPDTKYFYDLIMGEYIRNVARITSIDSVFRCMLSFRNFTQNMRQREHSFLNGGMTPISYNLLNCIKINLSPANQK